MGWSNDLVRVANGFSLVAKEAVNRQGYGGRSDTVLKKAILSATNLTGLTKGKIRRVTQEFFYDATDPVPPIPNGKPEEAFYSEEETHPTAGIPHSNTPDFHLSKEISDTSGQCSKVDDAKVASESRAEAAQNNFAVDIPPNDKSSTNSDGAVDSKNLIASDGYEHPLVKRPRKPRERKVPSTPFSRAIGFAGLGAGLAWGTLQESAKRLVFGTPNSQGHQSVPSPFLSEKNAERMALALCRMRGAALKLGQMLSIQDESLIPAPILAAFDIVRQGADVMPRSQLNQVLNAELGPDWSSRLRNFDYEPMAAASIGQVHKAVTTEGLEVAMKIQYPGVADSIESDIENVKLLLNYTNLIPEGLFLDNAMKVAKKELSRECDYVLEAENQKRFRELLMGTEGFYVPAVVDSLSSKRVLTTELVSVCIRPLISVIRTLLPPQNPCNAYEVYFALIDSGVPIDKVALLDQETRNDVAKKLLQLTLMELFVFRFMQTDPNWSNFLYDQSTHSINLIDFGAAQAYPKHFVDDYLRMVMACSENDREAVIEMSRRLGFLTGIESEIMLEAHVQAGFIVGLPFAKTGGYDFRATNITTSVSNLGATMLRHRLTPPPEEAYSLHRKLSGAFLACIKLGAVVPCRELLLQVYRSYQFGNNER